MKSSQLFTVTCTLRVRMATIRPTQPIATPSNVVPTMTPSTPRIPPSKRTPMAVATRMIASTCAMARVPPISSVPSRIEKRFTGDSSSLST